MRNNIQKSVSVRVFRFGYCIDTVTGAVTEFGEPLQTFETARNVYNELFDHVKDPRDWKRATRRVDVSTWTEAQLVAEALTYFLGGAEVEKQAEGGYRVGSRGYYHYIHA